MTAWLVCAIFGAWAILSLLVLTPRFRGVIRNHDVLSLIPEWKFFGPHPGQYDYYLLYRDVLRDGDVMPWREVVVAPPRGWWNFAWNPGRRGNKALFDLVTEFGGHLKDDDPVIEVSIPYLTMLNTVSAEPRLIQPDKTQFMVLMSFGINPDRDMEMLYVSKLHEID